MKTLFHVLKSPPCSNRYTQMFDENRLETEGELETTRPDKNTGSDRVCLLQLVLCRMTAVKCLPVHHHRADYIFSGTLGSLVLKGVTVLHLYITA